jgi:hypothetical protein
MADAVPNGFSAYRCGEHASQLEAHEMRLEAVENKLDALRMGDKKTAAKLALYSACITSAVTLGGVYLTWLLAGPK